VCVQVLSTVCEELMSAVAPLFIPCPNAREQIGANRGKFVPRPSLRLLLVLLTHTYTHTHTHTHIYSYPYSVVLSVCVCVCVCVFVY